jgi:hypothetical protein
VTPDQVDWTAAGKDCCGRRFRHSLPRMQLRHKLSRKQHENLVVHASIFESGIDQMASDSSEQTTAYHPCTLKISAIWAEPRRGCAARSLCVPTRITRVRKNPVNPADPTDSSEADCTLKQRSARNASPDIDRKPVIFASILISTNKRMTSVLVFGAASLGNSNASDVTPGPITCRQ